MQIEVFVSAHLRIQVQRLRAAFYVMVSGESCNNNIHNWIFVVVFVVLAGSESRSQDLFPDFQLPVSGTFRIWWICAARINQINAVGEMEIFEKFFHWPVASDARNLNSAWRVSCNYRIECLYKTFSLFAKVFPGSSLFLLGCSFYCTVIVEPRRRPFIFANRKRINEIVFACSGNSIRKTHLIYFRAWLIALPIANPRSTYVRLYTRIYICTAMSIPMLAASLEIFGGGTFQRFHFRNLYGCSTPYYYSPTNSR